MADSCSLTSLLPVLFNMTFKRSGYFVTRCIGLAKKSFRCNLWHSGLDSHHYAKELRPYIPQYCNAYMQRQMLSLHNKKYAAIEAVSSYINGKIVAKEILLFFTSKCEYIKSSRDVINSWISPPYEYQEIILGGSAIKSSERISLKLDITINFIVIAACRINYMHK